MRSFTVLLVHAALALVAVATLIGLVTLWPAGEAVTVPAATGGAEERSAVVVRTEASDCRVPGATGCVTATAKVTSGPNEGDRAELVFGEGGRGAAPSVGDRIRVIELPGAPAAGGAAEATYAFADYERTRPLVVAVLVFAVLVLLLSRLQGLLSLVGLALSLALVVLFVVPAILEGSSPVGVALVGALTVMFLTIPLCHGLGPKAVAASLGTSIALGLIVVLAEILSDAAHLSGLTTEEASFVAVSDADVSVSGLVVAGMVIGALGVLDDITVSQSSTVLALRAANPSLHARELFRRGLGVGRDHVSATVNTLVLAYVGASLPILLVFSLADRSVGEAVTTEVVAEAVVAMLVGSIGLILAVPITTGIAALLASRMSPAAAAAVGHEHAH